MSECIICGMVERDRPLEHSKVELCIGFPANEAWGRNVVITREAIQHISSSGQYKKLPKLIMEYMPTYAIMENDTMYIKELKIIGFKLEENNND
jgi:hypothetical protein